MSREAVGLGRSGWIAALAAVAIGCGESPTAPPPATSSTPAGPKAVSIAIGGMRSPLIVGESLQLSATLSYSDGSTRDVTREAYWWATSEAATITAGGLLTVVRVGFGRVGASYASESVGTSIDFYVDPAPRPPPPVPAIRGIVHEAAPRPGLALAGVRVEIAGGPNAGQATTTDNLGYFQFFGIQQAGFDLWASKRGYQASRYRIAELPRDGTPDIALPGQFSLATQRVEGTFAPECYQDEKAILTRSIYFTPGHDGVATAAWEANTSERAFGVWVGSTPVPQDGPYFTPQYTVGAGVRYEFRLIVSRCRPPMDGSYWIVLTWPR